MTKFKGFNFNEFEVIKQKRLPKLTTTWGASLGDWSFSGGISPIWEDGTRGFVSLKSTDDEDQMEEFEGLVKEFNEEATQEEWDGFYKEARKDMVGYYERQIKEYTEELDKLLVPSEEENFIIIVTVGLEEKLVLRDTLDSPIEFLDNEDWVEDDGTTFLPEHGSIFNRKEAEKLVKGLSALSARKVYVEAED